VLGGRTEKKTNYLKQASERAKANEAGKRQSELFHGTSRDSRAIIIVILTNFLHKNALNWLLQALAASSKLKFLKKNCATSFLLL